MNKPGIATSEQEAHEAALYHVKQQLDRGYTVERAAKEAFTGYYSPGCSGFEITHGKVQIPQPWDSVSIPRRWVFSFAALAAEIANPQPKQLTFL